jgi:DNA repair exonuclease SbcCD nuclease subunit
MSKIIIFSDAHIGYRQYGLLQREIDFKLALKNVVDQAKGMGVRTLIHAGDLLHSKRPSSSNLEFLSELSEELASNDMEIYSISGNHDYVSPSWIDVISRGKGLINLDRKLITTREGLTVYGCPVVSEIPADLTADILVLHTPIVEFTNYDSGNAPKIDDLPLDRFKVIAIGDTHVSTLINRNGCQVLSPGSTELNSASEPTTKYFYVLDTTTMELTPTPIKTRKVITLDINTEEDMVTAIEEIRKEASNSPIILGRYKPEVVDVLSRVKSMVDLETTIVRLERLNEITIKSSSQTKSADRPIVDFVDDFLDTQDPIYQLCKDLAATREGVDIINTYVDSV